MSSQQESIEPRAMGSPKLSSYNGRTVGLGSKEAIVSAPYYRVLAESSTHHAVRTEDSNIHKILRNPGNVRRTGFGFIGVKRIDSSPEGIKGVDAWGYEVELSRNGSLGLQCPLSNTQFQWYKQESGIPSHSNWLYPYGVCEYPVTFMRLVKEIYQAARIDSQIYVQQEYHNLNGFLLVGRHPLNPLFGKLEHEQNVYRSFDPIVSQLTVNPCFEADQVAYDLVKPVYASFGLSEDLIPLFDANHNFTP